MLFYDSLLICPGRPKPSFPLSRMSELSSFLSASIPEFRTPPPPRLQSLYSDIYRQKVSNPDGFKSSIAWWTRTLGHIARKGKQPQSDDHLILHVSSGLVDALRWEKVGRPLGLGAVVVRVQPTRDQTRSDVELEGGPDANEWPHGPSDILEVTDFSVLPASSDLPGRVILGC